MKLVGILLPTRCMAASRTFIALASKASSLCRLSLRRREVSDSCCSCSMRAVTRSRASSLVRPATSCSFSSSSPLRSSRRALIDLTSSILERTASFSESRVICRSSSNSSFLSSRSSLYFIFPSRSFRSALASASSLSALASAFSIILSAFSSASSSFSLRSSSTDDFFERAWMYRR